MRKLAHILVGFLVILVIAKYAHSCEQEPYLIISECKIKSNEVLQTNRNADGSYNIFFRPDYNTAVNTTAIEDITITFRIFNHSYADAGYFFLLAEIQYADGTSDSFQQLEYGIPGGQESYRYMFIDKLDYKIVRCINVKISY